MTQYRKKQVVINAWPAKEISFFAANDWSKIPKEINDVYEKGGWVFLTNGEINIPTLEGTMKANKDDMIIQGVNGEFYPCKQDIFEKTYELFKQEEQQKKTDDFKSRLIEEQKQLEEKLQSNQTCTVVATQDSELQGIKTIVVNMDNWDNNTIVHEMNHVIYHLADICGLETGTKNQEWISYMLECLFARCQNDGSFQKCDQLNKNQNKDNK